MRAKTNFDMACRRKSKWKLRGGLCVRCAHVHVRRRTRSESKSFPQGYRRHFRDYFPIYPKRIDPKTIRHFLSVALFFAECPIAVRADEKSLYAISEIDSVSLIVPIFNIWVNTSRVIFNVIQSITEKALVKKTYISFIHKEIAIALMKSTS